MERDDSVPIDSRRSWLLILWTCALIMFVMSEVLLLRLEISRDGLEVVSLIFWFPMVMLTVPLTSGLVLLRSGAKIWSRIAPGVNSTVFHIQIADMVCAAYVATLACLLSR